MPCTFESNFALFISFSHRDHCLHLKPPICFVFEALLPPLILVREGSCSTRMEQSPRLMYVLAAVFGVLPVVAVALRFFARRRTKVQLLWDDWTIVFSLVSRIPLTSSGLD